MKSRPPLLEKIPTEIARRHPSTTNTVKKTTSSPALDVGEDIPPLPLRPAGKSKFEIFRLFEDGDDRKKKFSTEVCNVDGRTILRASKAVMFTVLIREQLLRNTHMQASSIRHDSDDKTPTKEDQENLCSTKDEMQSKNNLSSHSNRSLANTLNNLSKLSQS
uniref:Uncharacterized protein n=1 Tax=Romanomermis culicivorax TaxID=13658 RepID=A0A915HGZ7_ROMCU